MSYAEFLMAEHEAMADVEELIADMKNRHAERLLAAYDKRCSDYRADGAELYDQCIARGMSQIDAISHCLLMGYGPRVYNPPVAAMVRYIVHR